MKTIHHFGNQGGLRHSLRNSERIKKTTFQGDKFEFSEKLKEKRNYILYVSGLGHETKEIGEIDNFMPQLQPKEELNEERQIIDNYQFHEIKNCKKNPKKLNATHHERLNIPLEKKTLKKYSSYTTEIQPISYAKTKTVKTTRFGKTLDLEEINPYNSFTLKFGKNKITAPSNMYETYKPIKNASLANKTRTLSKEGRNLSTLLTNTFQNKNFNQEEKDRQKYSSNNLTRYRTNQNGKKNNPDRVYTEFNYGENQTKTETKKEGEYLIKITTLKKQINELKPYERFNFRKGIILDPKGQRPDYRSRSESAPRRRGTSNIDNIRAKYGDKPKSRDRQGPYVGPYGSRPEKRSEPYEGPHGQKPSDRPRLYERPQNPKFEDKSGPHGPKPINRPGKISSNRPENRETHDFVGNSISGNNPRQSTKFKDRTFIGRRDRPNIEKTSFNDKVFPAKIPGNKSKEKDNLSDGKYKPSKSNKILTKKNNIPSSKKTDQKTHMTFLNNKKPSNGDNNYNYYESKHVVKKGRLNLPITIHHRRGENDDYSSQKYQRNSSFNKISQKSKSNLNNGYNQNSSLKINNKYNTRQNNNRNIHQSTYRKEASSTAINRIGGRANNNIGRELTPDSRKGKEIKTFSKYQKYEHNNTKCQLNKSTEFRENLISKYQFVDDNDFIVITCPVHGKITIKIK